MGFASRLGRARISAVAPQAAAVCDRCGRVFSHSTLRFQYDYAGSGLVNKQLLVCDGCMDRPQDQLRAIVIPADPLPILNPRPYDFASQRTDKRITMDRDRRATESGDDRITQSNGDDMLDPAFETKVRITTTRDRRSTEDKATRITQLLPKNPVIPPRILVKRTRVTDKGEVRATVEADKRVTEPMEDN